jgi:surfeit locus 1 family protein
VNAAGKLPLRSTRFWVITLAAVAGMGITASLGQWQLGRAAEKMSLQAATDQQRDAPVLDGRSLVAGVDPQALLQRRVVLRGRWLQGHTVFLDNRQMGGKPGFYVLTPFRLADGGAVVLVQRGWAQRNFMDRTQLPPVPTPEVEVEVAGRIVPAPSKLYDFKGTDTGPIRQNLDVAAFGTEIRQPLLPLTVLQTGMADDGLQRDWPQPATGVEKHYGYAFQWFGLSALVAILYVWFQLVRRFRSAR